MDLKEYQADYYRKHKTEEVQKRRDHYRLNKTKVTAREAARRKHRMEWLWEFKLSSGCIQCGYKRCGAVLHCHHRDPATKSCSIAKAATRGQAFLEAEVAKCDVLCANCHGELHHATS